MRGDNKEDERFDDMILYREGSFKPGFPEVESNNKYIVKKTVLKPETEKSTRKLEI